MDFTGIYFDSNSEREEREVTMLGGWVADDMSFAEAMVLAEEHAIESALVADAFRNLRSMAL